MNDCFQCEDIVEAVLLVLYDNWCIFTQCYCVLLNCPESGPWGAPYYYAEELPGLDFCQGRIADYYKDFDDDDGPEVLPLGSTLAICDLKMAFFRWRTFHRRPSAG